MPVILTKLKPCGACTVNIATSMSTMSTTEAAATNTPAMRASPPAISANPTSQPRISFGNEIGDMLEVLERLAHFGSPREERVIDVCGHGLHLYVVTLGVQRIDEVVP